MKNKIFSLFGFAILALLVLTSFASATIAITTPIDTQFSQTTGNELTINYTGAIAGHTVTPTFSAVVDTAGKTITFTPLTVSIADVDGKGSFTFASIIAFGFDFSMKQFTTTLTLTENTTPVVTTATSTLTFAQTDFCAWDGNNATNLNDDLIVQIKDVQVTKGFGEDNKWYPEDEIEVQVKVKNTNSDDHIRNIVLEWGLFNKKTGKWTIEVSDENDFSLKDGEEKILTLKFQLDNMDEDFEDLDGGNLVFYARATGDVDATTEYIASASDSEDVSITIESDFVVLSDVQLSETASCGSQVQITADVWNIGDSNQDNVYVVIYNKDLGINKKVTIGDIDAFDNGKLDALITIPQDAEEKTYTLALWVYNEDDEVYQNDNDDESKLDIPLKVEGGCSNLPLVSVVANLQSEEVKAGQELVVKATITNTGSVQKTFNLELSGYEDWATLVSLDKTSLNLNSKATGDVLITLKVNADASGEKTFNIVAKDGTKVLSQPFPITLKEKASFLSGITAFVTSKGDNWYLWGIGALNVVLVLVIIFVAIKVVRKK